MSQPRTCLAAIVAALGIGSHAFAQHQGDFLLRNCLGRLGTGSVDSQGQAMFPEFLLAGEFGEIPDFTDDPGFDSLNGALPSGTGVGFTVRTALRVWQDSSFDAIPDERVEIRKGANVVTTPLDDTPVTGFIFGTAAANGKFHHHLGYTLLAPAESGVYLLELELWTNRADIIASEPIWILLSQQGSSQDLADADAYVRANLIDRCRADLARNGQLNVFDFLAFQTAFSEGSAIADFNRDCALNVFDFLAFQTAFGQGC